MLLPAHKAVLFPVFKGISTLFSIVAVLVCIPTNSVRGFRFLHTLSSIYRLQTFEKPACMQVRKQVRTRHGTTDWFQIGKGVHQGCILSPCLFNLYEEYIMRNAGLVEAQEEIKIVAEISITSVQFSSVAQSCPTLCDPVNRSTPGLPVHHQLPEFTQTHVHRISDAIQPSHLLSSPSPPAPNPSQHQSLFQ